MDMAAIQSKHFKLKDNVYVDKKFTVFAGSGAGSLHGDGFFKIGSSAAGW
ncbi:hypothetical protein JCM30197_17780 [Schleiferia thermophila]|nr:hypothetical protein JCM30197_17780 [Schleiferia thermophila]